MVNSVRKTSDYVSYSKCSKLSKNNSKTSKNSLHKNQNAFQFDNFDSDTKFVFDNKDLSNNLTNKKDTKLNEMNRVVKDLAKSFKTVSDQIGRINESDNEFSSSNNNPLLSNPNDKRVKYKFTLIVWI